MKIDAHIVNEIEFGYGLFGRIEKGGAFQIVRAAGGREPMEDNRVNVHISGRVVFFKSINRDQDVTRSAFKPMASNTSVQDAVTLLNVPLTP